MTTPSSGDVNSGSPAPISSSALPDPAPDAGNAMTRSEETLRVGVRRHAVERVRLRKRIVSEEVTQTVVVRREELQIEREAVDDAVGSDAASDDSSEDYEIVLYAERPVVRTEIVPVERIRVRRTVHSEQRTVTEDLRKEQIDTIVEPI